MVDLVRLTLGQWHNVRHGANLPRVSSMHKITYTTPIPSFPLQFHPLPPSPPLSIYWYTIQLLPLTSHHS